MDAPEQFSGDVERGATEDEAFDLKYLDPSSLRFFRSRGGVLRLTIEGRMSVLRAHPVCAFPFSLADRFVEIRDGKMERVGMIAELKQLSPDDRALVVEELRTRYFVPKIDRILKLEGRFGIFTWTVETDKGRREFMVKGRRANIVESPTGELLVTDIDGVRYRVPPHGELDARSAYLLDSIL